MLAANIGAGSTVSATAQGYLQGVATWWWVGSAAIGSTVLLTIFYTLLTVSLFVPIVAGLIVPRTTARDALASILAGVSGIFSLQPTVAGGAWSRPRSGDSPRL